MAAPGEGEEDWKGRGPPLFKEMGFRVRVFFCIFFYVSKLPPSSLCVLKATIYRQNVAWASKLVPRLLFL